MRVAALICWFVIFTSAGPCNAQESAAPPAPPGAEDVSPPAGTAATASAATLGRRVAAPRTAAPREQARADYHEQPMKLAFERQDGLFDAVFWMTGLAIGTVGLMLALLTLGVVIAAFFGVSTLREIRAKGEAVHKDAAAISAAKATIEAQVNTLTNNVASSELTKQQLEGRLTQANDFASAAQKNVQASEDLLEQARAEARSVSQVAVVVGQHLAQVEKLKASAEQLLQDAVERVATLNELETKFQEHWLSSNVLAALLSQAADARARASIAAKLPGLMGFQQGKAADWGKQFELQSFEHLMKAYKVITRSLGCEAAGPDELRNKVRTLGNDRMRENYMRVLSFIRVNHGVYYHSVGKLEKAKAAFADACEWNVLRLPRPPYDYACTICVAAARSGPLDDSTIGEVSSLLRQVMAAAQAGPVDEEEDGDASPQSRMRDWAKEMMTDSDLQAFRGTSMFEALVRDFPEAFPT